MPMLRRELAKIKRQGPKEILSGIGPDMFRDAYKRGMSLSAYMEVMNPSDPKDENRLDAFGRVMMEAGIVTRTIPEAGIYADTWEDAFQGDGTVQRRALSMEFCIRKYREAVNGGASANTRQIFTSQDVPVGTWLRPYVDTPLPRVQALTPAIPLAELIAITTPIDGNVYRAAYVTDTDNPTKRFVRVGETAEIPRITLVESERVVTLYKYGRAMESSYEALRRQRLDRVAMLIQLMAVQSEVDKVSTAISVIINGDGNSNTAATNHNLTTLDPAAVAGTITLKGWLAFKLQFLNPYTLTTILAQSGSALAVLLLSTGSANVPLVNIAGPSGFGGFVPINPQILGDAVRYGVSNDAPANKLVGIDARMALERVTEIGSQLTEIERYVSRQTEALFMTEVEGYAVVDPRAARILNIGA
jgi:hypothetical protein